MTDTGLTSSPFATSLFLSYHFHPQQELRALALVSCAHHPRSLAHPPTHPLSQQRVTPCSPHLDTHGHCSHGDPSQGPQRSSRA